MTRGPRPAETGPVKDEVSFQLVDAKWTGVRRETRLTWVGRHGTVDCYTGIKPQLGLVNM